MPRRSRQPTIVVVEGLPGSGKTTLAKMLEKDGWTRFPEVATETAAAQIAVAASDDLALDPFIMCEEVRREERARLSPSNQILLESSHIANLAWAKARADRFKTCGYETYLKYYQMARAKNRLLKISAYLLLDITPRVSKQRYPKVGRIELPDERFLSSVSKNLLSFHERLEPSVPLHVLDTTKSVIVTYKDARAILAEVMTSR